MMATMRELTQAGVKPDGTWYSPKEGEPFPPLVEKDMEGRIWTNDSVKGHVMVLNLRHQRHEARGTIENHQGGRNGVIEPKLL